LAHTKCIRRTDRFLRRGLAACQAEWQLIAATHNLLKLRRFGLAQAGRGSSAAGRPGKASRRSSPRETHAMAFGSPPGPWADARG
jgi:hypothetical protein